MIFFEELKKLLDQLRGKKNIFGYRTPFANQLYLVYCIMGNIYFTDKIHVYVKCTWFLCHLFSVSTAFFMPLIYVLYEPKLNPKVLLNSGYSLSFIVMFSVMLPFIIYRHRDRMEACVGQIDQIMVESSQLEIARKREIIDVRHKFRVYVFLFVVNFVVLVSRYVYDAITLSDQGKMAKGAAYPLPLLHFEKRRSVYVFLINNVVFTAISFLTYIVYVSYLYFTTSWHAVSYNQLMLICDQLDYRTDRLNSYVEKNPLRISDSWRNAFKTAIVDGTKEFTRVTKLIDQSRGFYESLSMAIIVTDVIADIVHVNRMLSMRSDVGLLLKHSKSLAVIAVATWVIYLLCEIGETLESAVSEVSLSIYSTPWYLEVAVRKDAYIFLCQSQENVDLSMMRVYPFVMTTFSRIMNFIWSAVRFLQLKAASQK